MTKILVWPIALLSFGLPLHGGVSVFLPDYFRWWKEAILLFFCFLVLFKAVKNLNALRPWDSFFKKTVLKRCFKASMTEPITWAVLFLFWGFLLVLINPDLHTSLIAFRYLGLGFFAFGLCYWLCKTEVNSAQNEQKNNQKLLHLFCTFLVIGTSISILFGLWAQFFGGFKFVENFYSSTISSWVPGQTLPLYHEAGGVIRMQGLASGPIELAHLALLSLVALWVVRMKYPKVLGVILMILMLVGIYFTASRSVELVLLLLLLGRGAWPIMLKYKSALSEVRILIGLLVLVLFLGSVKFVLTTPWAENNMWLNQPVPARGGTMDHFTRPVEAIKSGSNTLLVGQLGQWGPAARSRNLEQLNNDQAPIAENVFADWWVQLGVVGFLLGIGFLVACLYQFVLTQNFIGMAVIGLFFIPMNLATLFDMTPISLIFFIFLALLVALPKGSR